MKFFKKKDTSIPIDKYFNLVKPNYIYIKVTPHKSLKNHNTTNLAKTVALSYKKLNERVRKEQKKLWVETDFKISYLIDIHHGDVSFYFIVPDSFEGILVEKLKEIWSKATVEVSPPVKPLSGDASMYYLTYKKLDAFSLQVDKRTAEPLSQILAIVEEVKGDDRVSILYNFMPSNQLGWRSNYSKAMERFKSRKPLEREHFSVSYLFKSAVSILTTVFETALNTLSDYLGEFKENKEFALTDAMTRALDYKTDLSGETKRKKDLPVINTQILVASKSVDKTREYNNAVNTCMAYNHLDGDNELTFKKVPSKKAKTIKIEDYDLGVDVNTCSVDECKNFIQLPRKESLRNLDITHINVEECKVPPELQSGYVRLGTSEYKGKTTKVYLEEHKDVSRLPLVILGRQGGGKSTFLANYAYDCTNHNEGVIHVDFIKNCEVSHILEDAIVDKSKIVVLDLSTDEGIQSLSYNELKIKEGASDFERQEIANKKAQLSIELMNSVNINGEPLSNKMERYFMASANIVYLDEEATLRDVILCLQDHTFRHKILDGIPESMREDLLEDILDLKSLDEMSSPKDGSPSEPIGTKDANIRGILDRVTLLKRDFYLKRMFNKNPKHNIDFTEAMREGKVVLVRMPQSKFKEYARNVVTTFLVTKAWLSAEILGEVNNTERRTHFLIDELSQTKTAELFLQGILTRTRKMGLKFVVTGQYLDQLQKQTIKQFKGAGSTFMLLKGAIKEDFEYFKEELDGTFEYEDLKDMAEYSSLNIVDYSRGKCCFITKLPPELKKKAINIAS